MKTIIQFLDPHQPRLPKFLPFFLAFLAILVAIILIAVSLAKADWQDYSNDQIANAIYKAEGGVKAKMPYGVLSVKVKDEIEARRVCINTIRNNRIRFVKQDTYNDFIEFLGSRYCPISAHRLNKNWVKNVKFYLARLK